MTGSSGAMTGSSGAMTASGTHTNDPITIDDDGDDCPASPFSDIEGISSTTKRLRKAVVTSDSEDEESEGKIY